MKYYLIVLSFVLSSLGAFGQDTLQISRFDLADSVFGQLSNVNIPSHRLMNRLFVPNMDSTVSHLFTGETSHPINADFMYGFLVEKKNMSMDTSLVPHYYSVFQEAMAEMTRDEYEDQKTVIPFAIHEYAYQRLDTTSSELSFSNLQYSDNGELSASAFSTHRTVAIGPLFEFLSEDVLYLHLKSEWIFTDTDVAKVEIFYDGKWRNFVIDQLFEYHAMPTDVQTINFRVTFKGEKIPIERIVEIQTPGLKVKSSSKANLPALCDVGALDNTAYVDDLGHKLKWCLIHGCGDEQVIDKPFLLVTGYRPPLFDHNFEGIHHRYDDAMNGFLTNLYNQGFDVFILRFNYSQSGYTHGIEESADLLVDFLTDLNELKEVNESDYENVIMGASFGADVSRMAMMKMEKAHFDGITDNHHHTRLLVAYDAQFFGANLPLSMQNAVMSKLIQPTSTGISYLPGYATLGYILHALLYTTFTAKGAQETLMYNGIEAGYYNPYGNLWVNREIEPGPHFNRLIINAKFNALNRGGNIYPVPMPLSVRNVSVSLGRYESPNYVESEFRAPGQHFSATFLPDAELARAGLYSNDYVVNYYRFNLFSYGGVLALPLSHRLSVKNMYEVDGTSGSYMAKSGNFFNFYYLADFLSGSAPGGAGFRYTHKPVLSALAIRPQDWPASAHINLHSMGLMYNSKLGLQQLQQSQFYGYPNLGRPNDHFAVTPFEAVYCDVQPDPHINLEDSDYKSELLEFLDKEIEPNLLILQNHILGSEVRDDVTYKAKRRAKGKIVISYDESPMTDPGSYVIQPNAELTLTSEFAIETPEPNVDVTTGGIVIFEVQDGGFFEAYPYSDWDFCDNYKNNAIAGNETNNESVDSGNSFERTESEKTENYLTVFPNPSSGEISVSVTNGAPIERVQVFSLQGQEVFSKTLQGIKSTFSINPSIAKGNYIFVVSTKKGILRTKFIRK